ncbi:hypothetical protein VPNG_10204 [Cytospora leucostoma]|uniref:Mid2 domain-containing protein n=1 Tax=Cytospora leucostoma TaxID=1230097 RepID=A0A423VDB8_9PEZI|nr:hypothetical protein VPNG_10204 [Cytospora leucostoma]
MAAKCYDADESTSNDNVPCWESTDGQAVPCCDAAHSDSCASNGLCVASDPDAYTPYFIDGCTAPGWTNGSKAGCPSTECLDAGNNGVKPCGDGTYCCYGSTGCDCNNSTQVFSLGVVRIVTSLSPTSSASETGTATTTGTNSATTTTSLSSTATQPTSSHSSSGTSSNITIGLGVGLGVGLPLSLAVVAGLWLLSKRRGKRNTAEPTKPYPRQEAAQHTDGWQGYGYGYWGAKPELGNQQAQVVELPGAREAELEGVSMLPRELVGDTHHHDR